MKHFLEELSKDKIIHYILILIAATIAAIPLINLRVSGTDDGPIHILRIIGVSNILKAGEFPPLIYSNFCNGYGYAINVFYPPLVTYGPMLFKLFFTHYYNCLKIYSYITIVVSGFTMYQLVKEISNKREIALLSAIIYIFIPYRLETIYNRFAIGEFSAYMFIPLVFLGLYNLINGDSKKHYCITIGAVRTNAYSYAYNRIYSNIFYNIFIDKLQKIEK